METLDIFEKYKGCIFGLAVGDAIGYPLEFLTKKEIEQKFPFLREGEIQEFQIFDINKYSDDTQMSLAISNALLNSGSDNIEEIMKNISEGFINWYYDPENNRAPGNTCLAGVRNLIKGLSWKQSGIKNSIGCGSAMRTAPIGLAYYNNLDKLKEVAKASAIITHNSPIAIASAIGNAYLIARAVNGEDYKSSLDDLIDFTRGISEEFTSKLYQTKEVLHLTPSKAYKILGAGFKGHEAIAISLYSLINSGLNYRKGIITAINHDGDSDSTGCITGGIIGAYIGYEKIPKEFLRKLENQELLFNNTKGLYWKYYRKEKLVL